ncbi:TIGR03067 domain-containing protein [Zavarzinella formosa]|uniref:TIGR03067 domain-containing protein n=1 Tax=Zavarzinella formosa TaxID=360055 RepID=UPI000307A5C6|nr:TIGR03067 domain-containing protein [Zavarzinella formosa]
MIRFKLLGVLMFVGFSATVFAEDDQAKKDLEKFQGVWKVTAYEKSGTNAPKDRLEKLAFTFKESEMSMSIGPKESNTIKLDPSKKPGQLNITDTQKKVTYGIYEIDGDTLKMCFSMAIGDETKRPVKFATEKDSNTILMVLKREKK